MPQDEDSRQSDHIDTEIIESDSDLDLPPVQKVKRPVSSPQSGSSSSSSSSSTESSSDEASSSESSSSSSESSDEENFEDEVRTDA